jgi:hypothetical protein
MAKDPGHRPQSAVAFARALQGIERELQLEVTALALAGDAGAAPPIVRDRSDDDGTRTSRVQVVRPDAPTAPPRPSGRDDVPIARVPDRFEPSEASATGVRSHLHAPLGVPAAPPTADTVARSGIGPRPEPAPSIAPPVPKPVSPKVDPSRLRLMVIGAVVLLVVAVAVVVSAMSGSDPPDDPSSTSTTAVPQDVIVGVGSQPARPQQVTAIASGSTITVRWVPQNPQAGDAYLVTRTDPAGAATAYPQTTEQELQVEIDGSAPCFQVAAVRGDRLSDASREVCVG